MDDLSDSSHNFCFKLYNMVMNESPSIIGFRSGASARPITPVILPSPFSHIPTPVSTQRCPSPHPFLTSPRSLFFPLAMQTAYRSRCETLRA